MKQELLRLDLQHFADGETPDATETNLDGQTSDEPKVDAPQSESQTPEKTFTQADIDEAVKKRLERERKKYEGFDELKQKASEYEKQLEEKRLSELSEKERLEEIARKHEEEKQSYAQQLADLQSKMQTQAVTNAFIKAAPGVNIPSDRIDAALKLADLSAVTVGEDGAVEGLSDVMSALVEQYTFLAEKKKSQTVIGEPTNGNFERADKTKEQLLAEAAAKYRKTGRVEDMTAYSKLKRELGL